MIVASSFRVQAGAQPRAWGLREVSAEAGITIEHAITVYPGSFTQRAQGGLAVGDYDRDGDPDVFIATGNARPTSLLRNAGDGQFEDVAQLAGVALVALNSSGPLFFDYDGDGWLDLFVGATDQDQPLLFRNTAAGRFEDVTEATGLAALGSTISASAGDYDGDGFLDLFLSHWGEARGTCHLWRNLAGQGFECADEVAGMPDFTDAGVDQTFTGNFVDLDADGWQDLVVASDFGSSRVLHNRGGRFEAWSSAVISDENGMGAALGDYDRDGRLDWFVTSIWDPDGVTEGNWGTTGNRLYRGLGDGTFEDRTDEAGVREGDWGWAACFADLNHDGWLDLVHVNGWPQGSDQFRDTPARLFVGNGDGTFNESAQQLGFQERGDGRGLACFDYDRDGDLDLLVMNNSGPVRLWQNVGGAGNGGYLSVELRGLPPNASGVGATVSVRTGDAEQQRVIRAGSNYVSQDEAVAHFGLGAARRVESLEVRWPDGERTTLSDVAANQHLIVRRRLPRDGATGLTARGGGCSAPL